MTTDTLESKTEDEILDYIRTKLSFPQEIQGQLRKVSAEDFAMEHRRFTMSGYDDSPGECTVFNQSILNEFSDLGIYDYTHYLFLDFYKGTPTLYFRYWGEELNQEFDFNGFSTSEIIHEVFKKTIFSKRQKRRR